MGFNIANDSIQESAFVIAVVGVSLSIIAVVLRFVATKRAGRKMGWEDWSAVLATFFLIAYVVPFLYLLRIMNGKQLKKLTKAEIVKITKSGYVMSAQFCLQQFFAKFSILFLYYRLFSINRTFVICVYFLGTFQLLWSIATYIVHWFLCDPPAKLWYPKLKGHCINSPAFLVGGEVPNSLVDFALVGLAVWMIQSLRMKLSIKIKLSFLFALGALAGILGFVKIGQAFTPMSTEKIELMDPIWATVQQTCGVICCCAPIYKPLFPALGLFDRLRYFSGYISRRTLGKSSKSGQRAPSAEVQKSKSSTQANNMWKYPDDWVRLEGVSSREASLTNSARTTEEV